MYSCSPYIWDHALPQSSKEWLEKTVQVFTKLDNGVSSGINLVRSIKLLQRRMYAISLKSSNKDSDQQTLQAAYKKNLQSEMEKLVSTDLNQVLKHIGVNSLELRLRGIVQFIPYSNRLHIDYDSLVKHYVDIVIDLLKKIEESKCVALREDQANELKKSKMKLMLKRSSDIAKLIAKLIPVWRSMSGADGHNFGIIKEFLHYALPLLRFNSKAKHPIATAEYLVILLKKLFDLPHHELDKFIEYLNSIVTLNSETSSSQLITDSDVGMITEYLLPPTEQSYLQQIPALSMKKNQSTSRNPN